MQGIRSLLFVPGDSERKIEKALASPADALILDLEDAVAPERRGIAREICAEALRSSQTRQRLFVRINALDTADALPDLAAVVGARPFAIMLPKCRSAADVLRLDHYLSALEAKEQAQVGKILVMPIVTETGEAMFGLGSYGEGTPRLAGMLWGGEDLAADIGAHGNRDASGRYGFLYQLARGRCLLAATAARAVAVDAVYTDFRDLNGLRDEACVAALDGFTAKAAIHPDQAEVINEAFTPTREQAERAQRIVDAFAAVPGAGVAALDGRMLDRPHLIMAQRILDRTAACET